MMRQAPSQNRRLRYSPARSCRYISSAVAFLAEYAKLKIMQKDVKRLCVNAEQALIGQLFVFRRGYCSYYVLV